MEPIRIDFTTEYKDGVLFYVDPVDPTERDVTDAGCTWSDNWSDNEPIEIIKVYEDHSTIIIKEVPMFTISNILIIALIAFIVYKIAPKLTIVRVCRVVFKTFISLILKPFRSTRRQVEGELEKVKDEWNRADKD